MKNKSCLIWLKICECSLDAKRKLFWWFQLSSTIRAKTPTPGRKWIKPFAGMNCLKILYFISNSNFLSYFRMIMDIHSCDSVRILTHFWTCSIKSESLISFSIFNFFRSIFFVSAFCLRAVPRSVLRPGWMILCTNNT